MGWLSNVVSNPVGTVLGTADKVVNTVGNVGQSVIDKVKDNPLEAAALAAAGYYYYPEISAWVDKAGTAIAGTVAGASAGTTAASLGAGALAALKAGAGALSDYALPAAITASALTGANAAKEAAATQAAAADRANELLYKMYGEQKALQQPFVEGGATAQNRLMTLLGLAPTTTAAPTSSRGGILGKIENLFNSGNTTTSTAGGDVNSADFGKYAKDFSMADFEQDPGYAFRLSEGLKALDRQAAMRGGLISGGAIKAAQTYGQDQASQEYTNAFNRYQTNRSNQLQPLGNLITTGQNAAANTSAAAGNYGTAAGNNITSGAAATAAGQVGGTNALTSGLNQYLNYSSNQDLANAFRQSAYTTPKGYGTLVPGGSNQG